MNNQTFFTEVKSMIMNNQTVSFKVKGTSMTPFLKDGVTEVFITKPHTYKQKGIFLFEYKNQFLLHRLIKIKDELYYFRGDHLYTYEIVHKEDIIAQVEYYITNKKKMYPKGIFYHIKLHVFLFYKTIKMSLRSIVKG